MKKLIIVMAMFGSSLAFAQINVDINIPLPTIRFEAPPPLVVVQPGVQVVENYDEDLYVSGGYYWVRRDGHWFRSHDHKGHWERVEERVVPVEVARIPPGHYKHWKHDEKMEVRQVRAVEHEERHEEKHEEHEEHGHGEGHGHGHGKH